MPRKTRKKLPGNDFEKIYWDKNHIVAGVDEAGRGALAGPVVAAAITLPVRFINRLRVNDSKKLMSEAREDIFNKLTNNITNHSVGFIDNIMIDEINILESSFEAMHLAIANLDPKPVHLLIDGNRFRANGIPFTTIIEGDAKSVSIAAASIIAKVSRDRWMIEFADKQYPAYGFAKNKGYGTEFHIDAIKKHGLCPLHRRTFFNKFYNKNQFDIFETDY